MTTLTNNYNTILKMQKDMREEWAKDWAKIMATDLPSGVYWLKIEFKYPENQMKQMKKAIIEKLDSARGIWVMRETTKQRIYTCGIKYYLSKIIPGQSIFYTITFESTKKEVDILSKWAINNYEKSIIYINSGHAKQSAHSDWMRKTWKQRKN